MVKFVKKYDSKKLKERIMRASLNNDIVDIVGEYVNLRKKGANYIGICPFHEDTKPSLVVSPEKQLVNCFVCQEKAMNIFTFIKKMDSISFMQALEKLEKKDIDVFSDENGENYAIDRMKDKMNKLAGENTQLDIVSLPDDSVLMNSIEKCPQYLLDRINFETVCKFNLMKTSDRIIIPICENSMCKGWIGRDYIGGDLKYFKPANWRVGNYIFNLDNIDPTKKVIVVEGPFDAMSLVEKGYTNTISILGTIMSSVKIKKLIHKEIKELIMCLDTDKNGSGQKATKKIITAIKDIFKVYVATPPVGKDPDVCSKEELSKMFKNLKGPYRRVVL